MIQTTVMNDASEIVHYNCPGVPLYIKTARLSGYPDRRALCHWHDDLEWIHILEGCMNYYINGQRILLRTGDSLLITPRQMHYGYSDDKQEDCRFICILLHPDLITQNRLLAKKYLRPLLEQDSTDHIYVPAASETGVKHAHTLTAISALPETCSPGWELGAVGMLIGLFAESLPLLSAAEPAVLEEHSEDLLALKQMVSYIYRHYPEKVTLDGIAAAGNVCRSKCCAIFHRYTQQTPVTFLNAYRLKISGQLLLRSRDTVTEIALACGFHHMSYFSGLFCRTYGCTPREYRAAKRHP